MKLIVERIDEVSFVTEGNDPASKKLFIEGIFLQSAITNRNGRCYPEAVMDKEVARYMKEKVEFGTAYGELGHPNGPKINEDRISHRIVSLVKEGKNYVGKAQVSSTPMGQIARGLIEDGGKLGVSSRGMGSLKERNGIMEVQNDFWLATAGDIVIDPSAPDAFVNGIMESVDWVWDEKYGWKAMETATAIKQHIHENYSKLDEGDKLVLFNKFLKTL